jgi:hypothetical protein
MQICLFLIGHREGSAPGILWANNFARFVDEPDARGEDRSAAVNHALQLGEHSLPDGWHIVLGDECGADEIAGGGVVVDANVIAGNVADGNDHRDAGGCRGSGVGD